MENEKPIEFKNVRFFDDLKEVTTEHALNDKYIMGFYRLAKVRYHYVINDINNHDAILMVNNPAVNPNKEKTIWLEEVSNELEQILIEKKVW